MIEVVEEKPCVLLGCGKMDWALYIMRGLGYLELYTDAAHESLYSCLNAWEATEVVSTVVDFDSARTLTEILFKLDISYTFRALVR